MKTHLRKNAKFVRFVPLAALVACSSLQAAVVVNGSFETGDSAGWIFTDIGEPFDPLHVASAGEFTAFNGFVGVSTVVPSDGRFAVSNGFDGGGPGVISVAQDIGVVAPGDVLCFDFRAGWDLETFGATVARMFTVQIEPAGGGAPLLSFDELVAAPGTIVADTGPLSASHDLSGLAGTAVRVNFVWTVPEDFTGPANGQLDNVRIKESRSVPDVGSTICMLGGSILGIGLLRRFLR